MSDKTTLKGYVTDFKKLVAVCIGVFTILSGIGGVIWTIITCTASITTSINANSQAVLALQRETVKISDLEQYALQSERLNRKQTPPFEAPDVRSIVHGRITSPKNQE